MTRRTVLATLVVLLALPGLGAAKLLQGGHARDERITGTSQADRIIAGRGNDVVFARDRRRDFVNCGPGRDRAVLDRIDRALGCEVRRYPPRPALVVPAPPPPRVYAGTPGTVMPIPKLAPKPAPTPRGPPKPMRLGQLFGLVANADHEKAVESAARLRAKLLRVEFEIQTVAADVERIVDIAAGRGIEVIPQAGFEGRIPTNAEAASLGSWARELKGRVRWIEFGNETGYRHQGTFEQGAAYCRAAAVALDAMRGTGVGLLVQADDGNTGSGWISDCIGAAPSVARDAAGWTIHPYGPRDRWEPRLSRVLSELAAQNIIDKPLFVTEWGISTDDGATLDDNYGWPTNLTYAQTGAAIARDVPAMFARFPLIAVITYYSTYDLRPSGTGRRDDYFGGVRSDLSDKGAVSTAIRQLADAYRG